MRRTLVKLCRNQYATVSLHLAPGGPSGLTAINVVVIVVGKLMISIQLDAVVNTGCLGFVINLLAGCKS